MLAKKHLSKLLSIASIKNSLTSNFYSSTNKYFISNITNSSFISNKIKSTSLVNNISVALQRKLLMNNNIIRSFSVISAKNKDPNDPHQYYLDESYDKTLKNINRNYPFKTFFLSQNEAYYLNEHDRNLLLLKNNLIDKQETKEFMLKFFESMLKIKKLFPYLKGVDVFSEYFYNNINEFTREEFLYLCSKLDELKIFNINNNNNYYLNDNEDTRSNKYNFDEVYTKEDFNEIDLKNLSDNYYNNREKFYDAISTRLMKDISEKENNINNDTSNNLTNKSIIDVIKLLDQFTMSGYKNNEFWNKISNLDLNDITTTLDSKNNSSTLTNKSIQETKLQIQYLYNLSLSNIKAIEDSKTNIKKLQLLESITKTLSDTLKNILDTSKSNTNLKITTSKKNKSMIVEVPRVMEMLLRISLNTKTGIIESIKNRFEDEVFQYYEKKYEEKYKEINKNNNSEEKNFTIEFDHISSDISFTLLFKYLEYYFNKSSTSGSDIVDTRLFLLLEEINYNNLNAMSKLYFNLVIIGLRNLLLKQINSNTSKKNNHYYKELLTLVDKYYKDLRIKILQEKTLINFLQEDKETLTLDEYKELESLLKQIKEYFGIISNSDINFDLKQKIFYDIEFFENLESKIGALDTIKIKNSILTYC